MLCADTGSQQWVRVPMNVEEAQDIGKALAAVRGYDNGHGNGEVCIPLTNGLFTRIRIAIDDYRAKRTVKKTPLKQV